MSTPDNPFAASSSLDGPAGAPSTGAPPEQPGYGVGSSYGVGSGRPELAGWGSRVGSALVDGLAAAVIYVVGFILGSAVGGGAMMGLTLLGVLGGLAFTVWNLVQQGRTGQTIGKRLLGTRLLREQDGQVVGPGLSIGRQFVHVLDGIFYVGYLRPLWNDKKQTFADSILTTVVVKA